MLFLLMLIYTSNFVDRTILATLGQAIKLDLVITDAQLGLLQGLAFAVFYTAMGIPLARLSERVNRVSMIAICLTIWSGMTALCGFAQNFLQLFLCRIGVGIGEAGCTPPAHSLISDLYAPGRRATALAFYSFGIPLGVMFGAVAGGWLVEHFNWRVAMVAVGLPGVVLAIVFRLIAREPVRGAADNRIVEHEQTPPILMSHNTVREPGLPAHHHRCDLVGFVGYGTGTFAYAYFIRMFEVGYAELGLAYGLVTGLSAGVGTLLGGWMSDWAGRRDRSWYALLPAIGLLFATPLYIIAFTRGDWGTAIWWLLLPGLFHYAYTAPAGVMHNLACRSGGPRHRAVLRGREPGAASASGPGDRALIDFAAARRFSATGSGDFARSARGWARRTHRTVAQACAAATAQGTQTASSCMLVFLWHLSTTHRGAPQGWLRRPVPGKDDMTERIKLAAGWEGWS